MTHLKIGRVKGGTFTNLTNLSNTHEKLYDAIITFIDEAGLSDNEIIGFGNDTAQLLRTYLKSINVHAHGDFTSSAREKTKAKILKALTYDDSNEPFAILLSERLDALSFDETIEMVDLFNNLYTDSITADEMFSAHASRSPIGLLDAESRREYAYHLLNSHAQGLRPVVKDALFKVIEQSINSAPGEDINAAQGASEYTNDSK